MSDILKYDHERDWEAVKRIHFEVGWLDDEDDAKAFEQLAPVLDGMVFPLAGEAECAVFTAPGTMRHLADEIEMTAVVAVTTSRVARKLGAAQRLTAHAVADQAEAGSEVASLGMFDQGFYDRLGFGTGAYTHRIAFDPATLTVDRRFRVPQRVGPKRWRDVHQAMAERLRTHGGCVLDRPEIMRCDLESVEKSIGLGYCDGLDGSLSHFFWGGTKGEHGPYEIYAYAYQTTDQLFELLALIKSLGDQVSLFTMEEPPHIQLQDLLKAPFRNRRSTHGGDHAARHETFAYWQARILDLPKCLAKTHLDADEVRFNLRLTDPIAKHLEGRQWRGVAGEYAVTLGAQSSARSGEFPGAPTLEASVGAFTRLWLGVRDASSLALTDDLIAEPELLAELDRTLRLPTPCFGWNF